MAEQSLGRSQTTPVEAEGRGEILILCIVLCHQEIRRGSRECSCQCLVTHEDQMLDIFNFCLENYNKKQTVSVSAECTSPAFLLSKIHIESWRIKIFAPVGLRELKCGALSLCLPPGSWWPLTPPLPARPSHCDLPVFTIRSVQRCVVWSVDWADPLCVWMRLCKQRVSQLLSVRSGLAQHLI